MKKIYSISPWIDTPDESYKSYLLLGMIQDKTYFIISDEERAIIYRAGYIEAGGNFKVYRNYKGMWLVENEGFGSPTYEALFVGDLENVSRVNTNMDIVDLITGNVVIYKYDIEMGYI